MRQRTVSRSRARSLTGISPADEDDLRVGLQRLLDKLRQHQPLFTEDDVSAIPFPPEGSSSAGSSPHASPHTSATTSPRHSPSRADNEEATLGDVAPVAVKARKAPAAAASCGAPTSAASSASLIDLDAPLSAALFLTAVNIFDARMLSKSKRVSTDALKLVRQAYALIWRDPGYLGTLINGEPCPAVSAGAASSGAVAGRGRGASPPPAAPAAQRRPSHVTWQALFSAAAPVPSHQPDRRLALQLDECIRVLLVYANVSVNLCQSVCANARTLLLFAYVTCAARRLEEGDDVPYGDGPGSATDIVVGDRNLHTELARLEGVWRACGIEGRVGDQLRECYLIEFLLDAALPPAVCSARYDGLQVAIYEKKQRIVGDIVASRTGFAHVMRVAPLRGLCGLANMSAFGNPKLRARLLDKMASEGVVERLAAEMAAAMEAMLGPDPIASPGPSPTKRPRPSAERGGSPPLQRPRASASRSESRHTSLELAGAAVEGRGRSAGVVEQAAARPSSGLERLVDSEPTPVERIGQCVDILMLLTCPNLRPPDCDGESPIRASTSSASAVVRSTTWASRDAALHEISLYLLAICIVSKSHARFVELSSLQLYAADCVLQWAAYSGAFYAMVVRAMDELLDVVESLTSSPAAATPAVSASASRRPSLSPRRASNARLVSPPKKTKKEAVAEPTTSCAPSPAQNGARGRRLLRQLLPGDEAGLLPLLTSLLQYTIHAQAHTTSVQRWLSFLAERLLPDVFEVPQLTNGRRSSSAWGRQQQERQQRRSSHTSSRTTSPLRPSEGRAAEASGVPDGEPTAPVLARDLSRAEVVAAAPYFCFARRVVQETGWRDGVQPLFSKVVLLAFHVIVTQGQRCNLLFGQACACYDVVAPVLIQRTLSGSPESRSPRSSSWRSSHGSAPTTCRRSTALMHQREEAEEEERVWRLSGQLPSRSSPRPGHSEKASNAGQEAEELFIESAGRRRSPPSARRRQRGSPIKASPVSNAKSPLRAATSCEEDARDGTSRSSSVADDLSPFISSPSRSLVFFEAPSPSEAEESGGRDRSGRCSRGTNTDDDGSSSLRTALDEAATSDSTRAEATQVPPTGASPGAVTSSWTGRLSLRSLIASITGHAEAPLLDVAKRL